MASTDAAQLACRQSEFEQAVAYSLHLWPSLTLAVQNNWGGPDSADKRDWFAGAIVDLFPEFPRPRPAAASAPSSSEAGAAASNNNNHNTRQQQQQDAESNDEEPDTHYVEEVLLQVMLDEFEVNVDDDSSFEVAENIIRARESLANGKFDEVERLRGRFNALGRGGKIEQMFKKTEDEDQDTEWESDDSGEDEDGDGNGDVDMDEAPAPREKPAPEVDEDGFTKVTRKKR